MSVVVSSEVVYLLLLVFTHSCFTHAPVRTFSILTAFTLRQRFVECSSANFYMQMTLFWSRSLLKRCRTPATHLQLLVQVRHVNQLRKTMLLYQNVSIPPIIRIHRSSALSTLENFAILALWLLVLDADIQARIRTAATVFGQLFHECGTIATFHFA